MPLADHFRELRNRFFICAIFLVIGMVVGWIFYQPVYDFLQVPFNEANASGEMHAELNFAAVGGPFDIKLRVSAFVGTILASPVILFELWGFITPGLKENERKYAIGFVGSGVPLFLIGSGFGYFVLLRAVPILLNFTPVGAVNVVGINEYLNLVTKLILVFGIAFLLPVVLVALNLAGILRGKSMLKAWRWVVLLVFVFTAVTVPTPDPWTMIGMALPICALYFAAVGISITHDNRKDKKIQKNLDDTEASAIDAPSDIEGSEPVRRSGEGR